MYVLHLPVIANVLSSLILSPLMMETIRFYETSVLTRATRRHVAEDGILPSENKSKSLITTPAFSVFLVVFPIQTNSVALSPQAN
jgi:hypothetical protein